MKTVYLDAEFRCHVTNDGTMTAVETAFFDGKCDAYIEGYRFVPDGETWVREDGTEFEGEMLAPWKPWNELDAAQREYERAEMADMKEALALLGVNVDE
ncbi:MAG: hypothetical protein IIX10_02790 [Clostridia bacterium]|nr:hypothetical protein [Clostridia bacterium]